MNYTISRAIWRPASAGIPPDDPPLAITADRIFNGGGGVTNSTQVAAGEPSIASEVREILREDPPVRSLTDRQLEILSALVKGLTNSDIATALDISPNSVKWHL